MQGDLFYHNYSMIFQVSTQNSGKKGMPVYSTSLSNTMTSLTTPTPANAHSHHSVMTSQARHHESLPALGGSREQFHRQMAVATASNVAMNIQPGEAR